MATYYFGLFFFAIDGNLMDPLGQDRKVAKRRELFHRKTAITNSVSPLSSERMLTSLSPSNPVQDMDTQKTTPTNFDICPQ